MSYHVSFWTVLLSLPRCRSYMLLLSQDLWSLPTPHPPPTPGELHLMSGPAPPLHGFQRLFCALLGDRLLRSTFLYLINWLGITWPVTLWFASVSPMLAIYHFPWMSVLCCTFITCSQSFQSTMVCPFILMPDLWLLESAMTLLQLYLWLLPPLKVTLLLQHCHVTLTKSLGDNLSTAVFPV